jgi:hypothetical protein
MLAPRLLREWIISLVSFLLYESPPVLCFSTLLVLLGEMLPLELVFTPPAFGLNSNDVLKLFSTALFLILE